MDSQSDASMTLISLKQLNSWNQRLELLENQCNKEKQRLELLEKQMKEERQDIEQTIKNIQEIFDMQKEDNKKFFASFKFLMNRVKFRDFYDCLTCRDTKERKP
jgi:septal ring factor EnvC (AmiA/AmiB activator)